VVVRAFACLAVLAEVAVAPGLPDRVAALAAGGTPETFAAAGDTVVATLPSADAGRSTLRFARAGAAPKELLLGGRALGLALASDGGTAYALVRTVDRKGKVREVDLVPVDLAAARASAEIRLPDTARGLAVSPDGTTAFVVGRDEVRTFRLPELTSGPMYRVPGENVGVRPLDDGCHLLLVQVSAVGLVDLRAQQGREGLALARTGDAPVSLRAVMSSTPDGVPIALSDDGTVTRIEVPPAPEPTVVAGDESGATPEPAAAAAAAAAAGSPPEPPIEIRTQVEPPPVIELPAAETAPVAPPPEVASPPTGRAVPPEVAPPTESEPPSAAAATSGGPGTLSGAVEGAERRSVAAIVILGPDSILKEAARVSLDAAGRFTVRSLSPGAYRVVAAGVGGRVLICDPPYITVRVGPEGPVEAPVLHVLRAP